MSHDKQRAYAHLPDHLFEVIEGEYSHVMVCELFNDFFTYKDYSRELSFKMIDTLMNEDIQFDIAMICAFMIENQIIKIDIDDTDEIALLLTKLGLIVDDNIQSHLHASILLEGYTTASLPTFMLEFRRRLERARRIHDHIQGEATSVPALRAFIRRARQPCKLTLARYVLAPGKVVEQIMAQVKRSYGVHHQTAQELPYVEPEAENMRARLPAYERSILESLCAASHIYWVSEATSTTLYALVENPLRTVVIVIKPPGSDLEFEVKRTGVRGPQPLQVVYSRQGKAVPQAHRLHGGSMGRLLSWEAHTAALFARIYRAVHQAEAPLSKTMAMSTIYQVPTPDGDAYLTDYFTEAGTFGDGFEAMRTAMAQAVAAFDRENGEAMPVIPGALGLTLQFLSYVAPRQSLLVGSSSLRIDRLAQYLSAPGPHLYFTEGLQVAYTAQEAQGFADDLLEEILGVYTPPAVLYQEHVHYIHAALALPDNRMRADKNYMAMMQQLGTVWGTLLALHGYTRGESFVSRNVGVRSVWEQGQWRVKLLFMDHDDLHVMGTTAEAFQPRPYLHGMQADAHHIARLTGDLQDAGETLHMGLLAQIYQVRRATWRTGQAAFQQALVSAYQATRVAIAQHPDLHPLFDVSALQRLQEWDRLMHSYMAVCHDPSQVGTWEESTRQQLTTQGYREGTIRNYIESLEQCRAFLSRYPFLY